MNLVIRNFYARDRVQVIALWREVFPEDPPWNDPEAVIKRKLRRQRDLFLVGELEERVVATVLAGYDGFRGWISHLAVKQDKQSRGFGEKIMSEAERRLTILGCVKINLQVRSSNKKVIRFYEKCGYTVEDHTSMGKLMFGEYKK